MQGNAQGGLCQINSNFGSGNIEVQLPLCTHTRTHCSASRPCCHSCWLHTHAPTLQARVQVVRVARGSDASRTVVDLKICPDPYCESDKRSHFMWYYFR